MCINHRRLYSFAQLILDCICLDLIWQCTIQCRIFLNPLLNARVRADDAVSWAPPISLILPLWAVLSYSLRLYRPPDEIRLWTVVIWACENTALATTITAITTFFSRQFGDFVSRMFVPVMVPVAAILFILARYAGIGLMMLAQQRYLRPLRVGLVGDWRKAAPLIERLGSMRADTICGLIVPESALAYASTGRLPVLGTVSRIAELINTQRLDRVIVLHSTLLSEELAHCHEVFERMEVPVSCAVDVTSDPVRLNVSTQYGLPFLEMVPAQFTQQQQLVKRIFDLTLSAAALISLAPLFLIVAALIKFTSKGPILYQSPRVGKGGRHFTFLKFRSMYLDSDRAKVAKANEKAGHIFKIRNDPRVTPVGRVLRRYSLDELPQLLNVLRGEMSLVGPRPLPAGDLGPDGMSKQFSIWSEARSCVPPGLTGLWQVSGRSDLPFEDMVHLDLAYIQNWSLALDARIIFDTPMLILRGVGAY